MRRIVQALKRKNQLSAKTLGDQSKRLVTLAFFHSFLI